MSLVQFFCLLLVLVIFWSVPTIIVIGLYLMIFTGSFLGLFMVVIGALVLVYVAHASPEVE